MPELPEVETMVRGIRPHFAGRTVAAVLAGPSTRKPITLRPGLGEIARAMTGRTIVSVDRLGKRVVLALDSAGHVAIEPRMTGLVLAADPPTRDHLRLEVRFDDGRDPPSLWFWDQRGLGTVTYYEPGELKRRIADRLLGPDALSFTADDWAARLAKTNRPIKVALLDQSLVAGIGNLYASEILHLARIHPEVPASRLTKKQVAALAAAVPQILLTAIEYEGSTLGDGTYRNALNQTGSYQNAHVVYARKDETCRTCGKETILRIVQAQRSTFYCPRCQKPPRATG